jgi:hypothetical protein
MAEENRGLMKPRGSPADNYSLYRMWLRIPSERPLAVRARNSRTLSEVTRQKRLEALDKAQGRVTFDKAV